MYLYSYVCIILSSGLKPKSYEVHFTVSDTQTLLRNYGLVESRLH